MNTNKVTQVFCLTDPVHLEAAVEGAATREEALVRLSAATRSFAALPGGGPVEVVAQLEGEADPERLVVRVPVTARITLAVVLTPEALRALDVEANRD